MELRRSISELSSKSIEELDDDSEDGDEFFLQDADDENNKLDNIGVNIDLNGNDNENPEENE